MIYTKYKVLSLFVLLCQLFCISCSSINANKVTTSATTIESERFILADRNTLLMRGHSTNFVNGYMDGCESGQSTAGDILSVYKKNVEHAKIDHDYLIGWEQGNSFCHEHMRNLIKHSGSNNPAIYNSKESIEKEQQRIWSELKK